MEVKEALSRIGVESPRYSGHSFQGRAAITAVKDELRDATMKMLGCWQSRAYQVYIKTQFAKVSQRTDWCKIIHSII